MTISRIDELNTFGNALGVVRRSMDYEKFFGEMDLPEDDIQKRISMARELENVMNLMLSLFLVKKEFGTISNSFIISTIKDGYLDVVDKYATIDDYLNGYILTIVEMLVLATEEHIEEDWFLSTDRAIFIAENETASVLNHDDFSMAMENGYTMKVWKSLRDKKTRDTHRECDNQEIPIDEPFEVGDSLLLYPRDESLGADASEIVNCRCSVKYF